MDRRSFLVQAGTAAAGLSLLPSSAFAQSSDDAMLAHVHPELRSDAKDMLAFLRSQAPLSIGSLAQFRTMLASLGSNPATDIAYERREVPGVKGQPPVTVYVVNAGKGEGRPAILHTHGGGYVGGSAADNIVDLQNYARELGCLIVTVDYRLAPETRYRGSVEDNYAALKWLYDNSDALGVDRSRIAVMGESAGGGHAAILAIVARDRGEVPVAFQCLTYPMLDDRTGTSRRVPPHIGQMIWTRESNRFGWASFLGMEPGTSSVPAYAVPARVQNVARLPPAWIGVGSIDLFVNEDVDYAQRMNDAGVQTELVVVPGAFHGFDTFVARKLVQEFNASRMAALRRALSMA